MSNIPDCEISLTQVREAVIAEVLGWFGGAPEPWRGLSPIEAELVADGVVKRICLRQRKVALDQGGSDLS